MKQKSTMPVSKKHEKLNTEENKHPATENVPDSAESKIGFFQHVREDIVCVFERDPAAKGRTKFEVLTTYPGVHAIILHRISHKLWLNNWKYLARLLAFFGRMFTNIDIHPGAKIGRRFFIDHGIGVVIGETTIIGNNVTLYHGVTLGGTSWEEKRRHPVLGNGVLIGAGAKVLGPITLGDNVRVGANSVVMGKDVPAGSTVVGIPGKTVIRDRDIKSSPHGINLDHHLISDPVGDAMRKMLERISALEKEVERLKAAKPEQSEEIVNTVDKHGTVVQKKAFTKNSSKPA
ncbi:MAG: serine O-acetyltransferase [Thiotrichaceae bacterium IS1]|nr:MAG: serine O-acetyltransferase [Thiotrichaceae bacterium IS1]